LLAIASVAGGGWLQIGTEAALRLSGSESASQTIGVELLADIQAIFMEKQIERIGTTELIEALCEDAEKPWATYNKGHRISPRQVAGKLKLYGITTNKTIRTSDGTVKGFVKEQFEDAFKRYIPSATPKKSATTLQSNIGADLQAFSIRYKDVNVADKKQANDTESLSCSGVADKKEVESGKKEKDEADYVAI
jgi:putative DNA primase/helicase